MRILFLLDNPNLYGSEQHVLKLMETFRKDDEVSLVAMNDGPLLSILKEKKIRYTVIRVRWFSLRAIYNLFRFLKRNNFDIVHAHQPKAVFWGSIISSFIHLPCIITIHSLPSNNIQSYHNFFKKIIVGGFHHFVKFISELLASRVIYLSKFSFNEALFKKKSLIIPNWIDKIISGEMIKSSFGNPVQFISIGSVTYNKGMDRMIEALSIIKQATWELKIAGDYDEGYKEELLALAKSSGIADRITFLGYVNNTQELLINSDGFILLSRGETFGLVYIEAMNCGLPVIAWNIPVMKEILPQGNVIMSSIHDISKVFPAFYGSSESYQKVSSKNKVFADENFSIYNVYTKYRNLYDQVLLPNRN